MPFDEKQRALDDAFGRINAEMAAFRERHGIVRKPGDWLPQGPWEGLKDSIALANRERLRGEDR